MEKAHSGKLGHPRRLCIWWTFIKNPNMLILGKSPWVLWSRYEMYIIGLHFNHWSWLVALFWKIVELCWIENRRRWWITEGSIWCCVAWSLCLLIDCFLSSNVVWQTILLPLPLWFPICHCVFPAIGGLHPLESYVSQNKVNLLSCFCLIFYHNNKKARHCLHLIKHGKLLVK